MRVERWNKLLVATVIVLLWVAILALIKVLFSGSNGFEWGSVSDWFSFACNVVMAGVAVYAARYAKLWFRQQSYATAFNKAEGVLNKIDLLYNNLKELNADATQAYEHMQFIESNLSLVSDTDFSEYDAKIQRLFALNDEIRSIQNGYTNLSRWPIKRLKTKLIDQVIFDCLRLNSQYLAMAGSNRYAIYCAKHMDRSNFLLCFHDSKNAFEKIPIYLHNLQASYSAYNELPFSAYFTHK